MLSEPDSDVAILSHRETVCLDDTFYNLGVKVPMVVIESLWPNWCFTPLYIYRHENGRNISFSKINGAPYTRCTVHDFAIG